MSNKLELTWYGKEQEISVEPRLLIERTDLSNTDSEPDTENMLIHGDNLLALKALESKYAGQVKCIYIDPPYNTGSAFEHYDDNMEHSIWLNLMMPRLEILKNLLSDDGVIFIQIDDNEFPYLKLLCDQIFLRKNFVTSICIKMSHLSGVKMSHVEKTVPKLKEFILIYCKNKDVLRLNPIYEQDNWFNVFDRYKSFAVKDRDNPNDYTKWIVIPLRQAAIQNSVDVNNIKEYETFCINHADCIFRTARNRSLETMDIPNDNTFRMITSAQGIKKLIYKHEEVLFCSDKCKMIDDKLVPVRSIGDIWLDIGINNLHNEGGIDFRNGKKPEKLIHRVIEMTTQQGDLVLDSFLGSGTTCAVAHKMGRKYIGIEMGDHAYTHCKKRLDMVISGEDKGGISKSVNWTGGGGYRFYELAPTLINTDEFGEYVINPEYSAEMLAGAVALHEGFTYEPDGEKFWKQSHGSENSYLFVTTRHLSTTFLESIAGGMDDDEHLVIACCSYDKGVEKMNPHITVKKIPQMLLDKCEFDKSDYNLNIINPPVYDDEEDCNE